MWKSTKKEISHKISFIVPCYNEDKLVSPLLDTLHQAAQQFFSDFEIIVVNDGSTDHTRSVLEAYSHQTNFLVLHHPTNRGKGAAIRTALEKHSGTLVVFQDADHEYDPADLPELVRPLLEDRADVVYGSRFLSGKPKRALYFLHALGNRLLTTLTNILTGLTLTDMETGYKAIKSEILSSLTLRENRFGIEPELTMKLARIKNIRFYEVGISYYGRSFQEGKKINWKDGLHALYCLLKYRFLT
jgi:glycosyltransferase involved in cell wall biosynthesis